MNNRRDKIDIQKFGRNRRIYNKLRDDNESRMKIYREYINFIKESGYKKSGIEVVKSCEKMLNEVGYLTVKMQDTLEHVFTKALRVK